MYKTLMMLSILPVLIMAEEATESNWKSKAELGLVNTTGNTETSSTAANFNLIYDPKTSRQEFRIEQLESESQDANGVSAKTAERSYVLSKTDYKFSESAYLYGLVDYTDDRFSGYDFVINLSLGAGKTFIKEEDMQLSAEIGYGQRRSRFDTESFSPPPTEDFATESEGVTRAAAKFSSKVSENSHFSQELVAEFGEDFDQVRSISAFEVKINSSLALSLGYEVIYVSDPPGDGVNELEDTDTKTTVNLVYSF